MLLDSLMEQSFLFKVAFPKLMGSNPLVSMVGYVLLHPLLSTGGLQLTSLGNVRLKLSGDSL